jgi:beta-lactamase regulating signal transducer with metallopeptidase domain
MTTSGLASAAMNWTLWNSAGAAVVILLVLICQFLLKERISARWHYNLWILVLARLVLPTLPTVRIPVPQWAKSPHPPAELVSAPTPRREPAPAERDPVIRLPHDLQVFDGAAVPDSATALQPSVNAGQATAIIVRQPTAPLTSPALSVSSSPRPQADWILRLLLVWLAGTTLLLLRLGWTSARLTLATRNCPLIRNPAVADLLANCCLTVGISRTPRILLAPPGSGPALVGMWSPKLLLPHCVLHDFDAAELQSILLHEISHLKRRDIALNYVLAILQALHWFNPLVWLAFARMRADRELACDEAVLRLTPAGNRRGYGCTILRLLELLCHGGVPAGAMGVIQHRALMHRRIAMIAQFDPSRRTWSGTGMMLSLLLIIAAAVSAVRAQQAPSSAAPNPAVQPASQGDPTRPALDQARQSIEAAAAPGQPPITIAPPATEAPPLADKLPPPAATPAPQPPPVSALPGAPSTLGQPMPFAAPAPQLTVSPNSEGGIVSVDDSAATEANAQTAQKLQKGQSVHFEGVSLRDVLNQLADAGSIDIILDEKALTDVGIDSSNAAVTMNVREARPLEQVLQLALRLASRDIDYSLVNGVVFVSSRAELARHVVARAYGIGLDTDRNELAELIFNTLGRSPNMRLAFLGDKLIITAPEPSQRQVARLLALLPSQTSRTSANPASSSRAATTSVYSLKYARADELSSVLSSAGSPNLRVAVEPRTNQLIVTAPERDQKLAEDLLRRLDQPGEQGAKGSSDKEPIEQMRSLAHQAMDLSSKYGAHSPQVEAVGKQLDALGQKMEALGEQLSKEGRDADALKLRAEMEQIKAIVAPLRSELESLPPAVGR